MSQDLTLVSTHVADALSKKLQQLKSNKPNFDGLLTALVNQLQLLENNGMALYQNRALASAVGSQLDQLGSLLNYPRYGLTDNDYRIALYAQIAANVSNGTPSDVANIFALLAQARYVTYSELYPAQVYMTAINASPIGDLQRIKDCVNLAKPIGTQIYYLAVIQSSNPFVFADDTDPLGRGFGDVNDSTLGGSFAISI